MQAISREISTQALREKESNFTKKKEQVDLYERLSQHQDYERRLQAMVSEKNFI